MKKFFFFSLGLLVLVLIFLGAYNLVFKNNVNNPIADPTKKLTGETDTAFTPQGSVENILNERVLGATADKDDSLYYYSLDERSLKKSTLEGKNKMVLMSNLPGEAVRVLWSEKKDKALLFLQQASGGSLWYYAHLGNKTIIPLKSEMSRLSWDNFGEKIFYHYSDPVTKKSTLNVSDPDGSNWKKLADLDGNDLFLASVPKSSLVSFWKRPDVARSGALEAVSVIGESRTIIFPGLFGADYLWAPNGDYAVASGSTAPDGNEFSLHLVYNNGTAKNLVIPTLISKVVWSQDGRILYYALPGGLPEGTALPNDYFEKPLFTKDTFWKVDIQTGKKIRLFEPKDPSRTVDSSASFLAPKEDFLYFIDRVDKRLYRIEL